jgi:hypothetical protein
VPITVPCIKNYALADFYLELRIRLAAFSPKIFGMRSVV